MSGYSQDEVIFAMQTKCTTLEKLLAYRLDNQHKFTTVHLSVMLAKLRNFLSDKTEVSAETRSDASTLYNSTCRYLIQNLSELDVTSLSSTLSILAKDLSEVGVPRYIPDQSKLAQIESHIIQNFDAFINSDISVVASSLLRLHYPAR